MKHGINALGTPALALVIILAQTVPSRQNPANPIPTCDEQINKIIDRIVHYLNDAKNPNPTYNITICVSVRKSILSNDSWPEGQRFFCKLKIKVNCSIVRDDCTVEVCGCPIDSTTTSPKTTATTTYNYNLTTKSHTETSTKSETTAQPTETSTKAETTTSPAETEPQANATEIAEGIEKGNKNLTNSSSSNPARIIEVKYFSSPELGSAKEPVYSTETSETKVEKIVIEDVKENARAVIIDQEAEPDMPTLVEQNEDTDSATNITEIFSDRFLSVSAFSGLTMVSVKKLAFSIDISKGSMKYVSKQIASSGQLLTRKIVQSVTPSCSFINGSKFSTKGCEQVEYEPGKKLSCSCNHATVFAVLMSANVVTIPPGVKIVSYITEAFSILFLILTVALLGKVRNRVRGDRVKVQICVAASVLVLHILNVLHDAALQNDVTCAILTVLIHYFLLCSAMWMLMEGITLLFKTLDSVMRMLSGENAKKFAATRYALSFGVPFVIVLISASYGFSQNNYVKKNEAHIENDTSSLKYEFCSIGNPEIRIGAVIIPIALILTTCFGVVIRMFYVVYKMSSESENYKPTQLRRESSVTEQLDLQHVQAALKATLVLLPVLGVPWFLGFFTSIENGHAARIVFMYLNAIVNGLQGVFLFFVYCVIGKEVRHAILKSYARKKYSLASSFEFISKRRGTTTMEGSIGTSLPVTATTNLGDNYTVTDNQSHKSVESEKSDAKENAETNESKA